MLLKTGKQAKRETTDELKALREKRAGENAGHAAAVRESRMRMTMQVMGISIIASAVLILATKTLLDELFVQDDWSDVDWGDEEEDFDIDIEMN